MAGDNLRKRENWQTKSGTKALVAENEFHKAFLEEFQGTDFEIRSKPREFRDIYNEVKISKKVLDEIYSPDKTWIHGIAPDFAICNIKTKKILYVEVKRQDGWVEGKPPKAGRGNAHERSCKYFTPGLLKILRESGNHNNDVLPFWVVFQGDITRDPKRVREITTWYDEYTNHFFFWRDVTNKNLPINHFKKYLSHLLK